MKKLLYLVPLLLIGLSASPVSLYKDKVYLALAKDPTAKNADLTTLTPGHWKSLGFDTSFSGSLGDGILVDENGNQVDDNGKIIKKASELRPKVTPISENGTFHGFPFGAYFSSSNTQTTDNSTSSTTASGYSWLWAGVDLILLIISIVVSFKLNRKKKEATVAAQPITLQPVNNSEVVTSVAPQSDVVQPTAIAPSQPTQSPQPVSSQPEPSNDQQLPQPPSSQSQ